MATINEDYVSFETAKLLKEKGFNECPLFRYDDCGYLWVQGGYNKTIKWHFPAPTLQMVMKWFREVHNLFVFPFPQVNTNKFWAEIYQLSDNQEWENLYCESIDLQDYPTYEDVCEAAIKYCLENLI